MDAKKLSISPVSKELLYIKIVDAIHSYVRANDLQPGDKLPSERDLAELFQTGRNSVREALRVLENQGLVEVRTGRGTFLRRQADEEGSISIELIKTNFREVQELTQILETACLRMALKRQGEGVSAGRQQLLLLAQKLSDDAARGFFNEEVDHSFHAKLAEMSGNATIAQLVKKLREEIFGQFWGCLEYDKSLSLDTVSNHMNLARAILSGSEDDAQKEMEEISRHTEKILDTAANE